MTATDSDDKQAFAALIASKLCHDLISPVSALGNALELLEMEADPAMREAAMELLADGAAQTARRLRFYRLAFGAAGGAYEVDVRDIKLAAEEFVMDAKPALDWQVGLDQMKLDHGKIILNLIAMVAEALPRGGAVAVNGSAAGQYQITGTGPMVRLPDEFCEILDGLRQADNAREAAIGLVSALLKQEGLALSLDKTDESIVIAVGS